MRGQVRIRSRADGGMLPDQTQGESAGAGLPDREDAGLPDREDGQALPVQSREDTDIDWGEEPEPDEDDRLHRDRPPHWESE
jgi:hypothetical protein